MPRHAGALGLGPLGAVRGGLTFGMGQYKHHVFVCTYGKSCERDGSIDVFQAMKRGARDAGLQGTVRVNKSGCMNQCGHGPMVVIYPQDVWYAGVDEKGARQIVAEHLVGGTPVKELRYVAPPGDNKTDDAL